jgi:hypothetical protein
VIPLCTEGARTDGRIEAEAWSVESASGIDHHVIRSLTAAKGAACTLIGTIDVFTIACNNDCVKLDLLENSWGIWERRSPTVVPRMLLY